MNNKLSPSNLNECWVMSIIINFRILDQEKCLKQHITLLRQVKYIQLILYLKLLGSFRSRFVSEYDRKVTANAKKSRDQTPAVTFAVHVWTSSWEVTGNWASSTLFVFLVESSHMCPIIMGEVFFITIPFGTLENKFFLPYFVFEIKDLYPLCNSRWRAHVNFFQVKSDVDLKS